MLGVRFVLSDTAIDIADFTQVERLEGPQAELLLYRLEGANLANWAPGWSLALLPLQFSHCWSPTGENLNSDVHLLRANYLLTGLLFKGTVDVRYKFDFGLWRSRCRIADAEMVQ
jgi:hypothetical protein